MSNDFRNLSGKVDGLTVSIYRAIDRAATEIGAEWVIIGATARDLIYEKAFGIEPRRKTADVDLAIQVASWDAYARLRTLLLQEADFTDCPRQKQRLLYGRGLPIDIVPFGDIELEGHISWPPDHDFQMGTAGFRDALASAIRIQLDDSPEFFVPVVNPAVLVALKIFAWDEHPDRRKDADDVQFLLDKYERVTDNQLVLYKEHEDLLEDDDFDHDLAYSRILGRNLQQLLSTEALDSLRQVVNREAQRGDRSRLLADMIFQSKGQYEICKAQLINLAQGLADRTY